MIALAGFSYEGGGGDSPEPSRTYKFEGMIALPHQEINLSVGKVTLNGGTHVSIPRYNGKFVFHNLKAGTYILTVSLGGFVFSDYRIEMRGGRTRVYKLNSKQRLPTPLQVKPMGR